MSTGDESRLPLDADESALVEAAADFARRRIAPHAAAWERDQSHLPRELFREWADLGLISLQLSKAAGGRGASYFCKIAVAETIARTCMPSCFALINAQGSVTRLEREGSPDQIARYLPRMATGALICAPSMTEPGAGSDFAALATTARKVAGGWVLDGAKAWITNGAHADLVVLYAQTDPGSGARGIASFFVDLHAAGVTRRQAYKLFGGHAIGAAEIGLSDVFVPDADALAPPGEAFKMALTAVSAARTHVAAMACGIVAGSLERAVTHAHERQSFGRPLIKHQGLRWSLADVATELEAARCLTYRAAHLIARGEDATMAAAQAKCFAADMALRGVSACMQAMGAIGLGEGEPFGRHLASARIAAYVDGTTEMQRDRIGALLERTYGGASAAPAGARR